MKITPEIDLLEIAAQGLGGPSRIYPTLVKAGDDLVLIDAGFPGQTGLLREAIAQAGGDFERLRAVILTHHDIDHLGGAASLQQALPGQVRVLAHAVEVPYINGEQQPLKLAGLAAQLDTLPPERKAVYEKLKVGFEHAKVAVDQVLTDGQLLPEAGGLRVVFTPGHTLGHICLYQPAAKLLIAGDALRVEAGELTATPAAINYDQELYERTLQKLAKLEIEQVICYHGGYFQGAATRRIAELAAR